MCDKNCATCGGCKARWNKSGNTKVGGIWTWSTLYSDQEFFIEKLNMYVNGTCGGNCQGCKDKCYVKKSYRYTTVKYGHARNTIALRLDPVKVALDLIAQIKRARNQPAGCRFNQSGEIERKEDLEMYNTVARACPDKFFYVYTKNYDVVIPALLNGLVPSNMIVLISIWHEYGISAYNLVKHLPNVKAFVYDDHDFDYSAAGLKIQTYCGAYDINGKMDHDVTCDKCKKCFFKAQGWKVIASHAH